MLVPYPNKFVQPDPLIVAYEGEVTLVQDYFIVKHGTKPIEATLRITYQARNSERCEQPVTRRVPLVLSDF